MIDFDREALLGAGAAGLVGDPHDFQVAADLYLSLGDEATALIALDRAYGLAPNDTALADMRAALLDHFAVEEHGLVFRYVPAGTFLMGSVDGDPDERPVHAVSLDEYWIADVPMTWSAFCRLEGMSPPEGDDDDVDSEDHRTHFDRANQIRRQYCGSEHSYDRKPMVAVDFPKAESLVRRLNNQAMESAGERYSWGDEALTHSIEYALPSEAEWEKAARGGLIGKRYPWGDQPPTQSRCDFNHFGDFRIAESRAFPANGYGLYAMAGGVWEWTSTIYDALAYGGAVTPVLEPTPDQPQQRVLRGGSWADAAAAVTVSFRSAAPGTSWQHDRELGLDANIGFRLVRRRCRP
jgi:sulfatase modifying factor 1